MDGVYIHIRDEHASDGGLEGLCLMQATLTEKADLEQIDPPEIGRQLSEFNNLFFVLQQQLPVGNQRICLNDLM